MWEIGTIEGYTFADCESLTGIAIPESVTEIGQSAFADCRKQVIRAPAGSHAEEYAKENGIKFEAEN